MEAARHYGALIVQTRYLVLFSLTKPNAKGRKQGDKLIGTKIDTSPNRPEEPEKS